MKYVAMFLPATDELVQSHMSDDDAEYFKKNELLAFAWYHGEQDEKYPRLREINVKVRRAAC